MKRIVGVILVVAVLGALAWALTRNNATPSAALSASGTIEVTEVRVGPEAPGRVAAVLVSEGDIVRTGDALVRLDPALLDAQRRQAEARLASAIRARDAAEAAHAAARAQRPPSVAPAADAADRLALGQEAVDDARAARDAAQRALDALAPDDRAGAEGDGLRERLAAADAGYDQALAAFQAAARRLAQDREATPSRPASGVAAAGAAAARAQVDAAEGLVEAARSALAVLDVQRDMLTLRAPIDGTILVRAVEPGEVVGPGATLLMLGRLDAPRITVYVPEDRVGELALGAGADVTVDAFPDTTFRAIVAFIDDHAQFTPRNVQTGKGRRTTVFAVRLDVADSRDRLKPGMPADVTFDE